jgi:transposase
MDPLSLLSRLGRPRRCGLIGQPPLYHVRSASARTARAGGQGDVESAVAYDIRFGDEADEHMAELTARQRARVLDAVDRQLLIAGRGIEP